MIYLDVMKLPTDVSKWASPSTPMMVKHFNAGPKAAHAEVWRGDH
jgi:hypothetical protein